VRQGLDVPSRSLEGRDGRPIVLEGTLFAIRADGEADRAEAVITAVPRGAERLEEVSPRAITDARFELGVRLDPVEGAEPAPSVLLEGPLQGG
jgi:hypothetical protein